jgi:hypothetical protein
MKKERKKGNVQRRKWIFTAWGITGAEGERVMGTGSDKPLTDLTEDIREAWYQACRCRMGAYMDMAHSGKQGGKDISKQVENSEWCYGIQAFVGQLEKCPKSKRIHIQGAIILEKYKYAVKTDGDEEYEEKVQDKKWDGLRMKGLKEIFGDNTMHLEPMGGTEQEAFDYCLGINGSDESQYKDKPGIVLTGQLYGKLSEKSKQGKRNDLIALRQAVMDGATEREIVLGEDTGVAAVALRCPRALETLLRLCATPRDPSVTPKIYLLIGPPNSGKSSWCLKNFPDACVFSFMNGGSDNSTWFDNYSGQKEFVLDDFKAGAMKLGTLMKLCDRVPFDLQVKGVRGGVQLQATTFIITSNSHPSEWYPNMSRSDLAPLWSRLMPPNGDYPGRDHPDSPVWSGPQESRGWGEIIKVKGCYTDAEGNHCQDIERNCPIDSIKWYPDARLQTRSERVMDAVIDLSH